MLICIYACSWPLMRLGGAFLIKASSEAGPLRGEEEMSQQSGCGPGRKRLAELSLVYKIRVGLVAALWLANRAKDRGRLGGEMPAPAPVLVTYKPSDKS